MLTIETAFSIWQEDANQLKSARLPDVQVPLMALVGVYAHVETVPKNVYAFRKIVIANDRLCATLATVIPKELRSEFEDLEAFPIDVVKVSEKAHQRAHQEEAMLMDGLPEAETMITSQEYFLTRFLGQTAHNYAVYIRPLRLNLQVAQPTLRHYFPQSLALIEGSL